MPASTVTFNGFTTSVPGAYARINPNGLTGSVAGQKSVVYIGEAVGGIPVSVLTEGRPTVYAATNQNQVRGFFRSGLLRTAGLFGFTPGGGRAPQRELLCKVNPATKSTGELVNLDGPVCTLASVDYGAFTSQTSVSIAPGTALGYKVTAAQGETVQAGDDIGGTGALALRYSTTGDFDTVRGEVSATGLDITYTKDIAEDEVTATHTSGDSAVVRSANAYDTVQQVTVYGLFAGSPVSETVTLNGTADVTTTQTYASITAVRVNGGTRGIITVEDEQGSPNVAFTIAATITANQTLGPIEVVSSSALDVTQRIVVTGTAASGAPVSRTLALNGTTVVPDTAVFAKVLTAQLSGATVGNVTVRGLSTGPTAFVISAGNLTAGINIEGGAYIPVVAAFEGPITLTLSGAGPSSANVVVRGVSSAGIQAAEAINITATPAATVTGWASVSQIEIGLVDAAQTIFIEGTVRSFAPTAVLADVVSVVSSLNGFGAEALVAGAPEFTVARLDYADNSIKSASNVEYLADLDAIITYLNTTTLVSAARVTGASGPPSITPSPVFLVGGSEGVTSLVDWAAAFDAMRRYRNVYIVPLSTDPAVHALLNTHLQFMDGEGNHPQSGFVSLSTALSKASIKSAINAINNRNIAAIAQGMVGFNPDDGIVTTYGPEVLAAIAGAQNAGLGVGIPLTRKNINAVSFAQSTTWSPDTDANEMIAAGLMIAEVSDQTGPRWVRSVTTYRSAPNPVFTEVSANDSANESIRRTQTVCDTLIGEPAFDGFAASLEAVVVGELERQVNDGVIRAYQSVSVTDGGDTFVVGYQLQALEGVNFILITANLRRFAAAA